MVTNDVKVFIDYKKVYCYKYCVALFSDLTLYYTSHFGLQQVLFLCLSLEVS